MRRIFFFTTLLFVLMAQYPQVSFAEKRNLIFTVCKINPSDDPKDAPQRTIMMMPSVAIDEYEQTNINTCLYLKDHLEDFLIAHAEFKNRLNSNLH